VVAVIVLVFLFGVNALVQMLVLGEAVAVQWLVRKRHLVRNN
jgi:hypothetical protein